MDLLAHACYGATLCSRSGLAGGKKGFGRRSWVFDATVWWSVFFGLLPDMLSMWVPFALFMLSGVDGNFFALFDSYWLEVYRFAHSLFPALLLTGIIFFVRRKLTVTSLAWTVHILCDAVSHDGGKFRTMLFYPISSWHIEGIAFWRHGWFMFLYWLVLVITWIAIILYRYSRSRKRCG